MRSPWSNDEAFTDLLAQHKIFCLPGTLVGLPGYVRVSLTASEAMIERAIPRFQAAWYQAQAGGKRSRDLDHA